MNIYRLKSIAIAATLVACAASAQAVPLLTEDFSSVAALAGSGWVMTNASTAGGSTGWYQGDATVFPAQAGADNSYIAANYNNAPVGGTISNWLITPEFSTAQAGTITFFAKADIFAPYSDQIAFGLSGGSSAIGAFTLGPAVTVTGDWTEYSVSYAAQGAGSTARFAISYMGAADLSNYVGIDTLTVSAVPEPSTMLLLAGGLLGVAAVARRAAAKR